MRKIVHKHCLKFYIDKDRVNDVKMYVHHFGLQERIDGELIDSTSIHPNNPKVFKWFQNEFKDKDNYRTLCTMSNVIVSTKLEKEEKENYIELVSLNDGI